MNHPRRFLSLGFALFSLCLASLASAQQPQASSTTSAYTYDFEPDDLIGETLSTTPPLLRVRPHVLKVTLLRPRASFVGEMLKSVEAL